MIFFTRELAKQIEQAFVTTYHVLLERIQKDFPDLKGDYLLFDGGIATYTDEGKALSYVHGLGVLSEFETKQLDEIEDFYFSKKCPAKLQLSSMASQETFKELAERGYQLIEMYNATLRPIKPEDKNIEINNPAFTVRKIKPNEERIWSKTMCDGFRDLFDSESVSAVVWDSTTNLEDRFSHLAFTTGKNSQPMGASMMSVHHGIGMLNSASTLPEFRKMGVQDALIKARIKQAAELGCKWVTLGAVDDSSSLRNAKRNGFEISNARLVMLRPFPG